MCLVKVMSNSSVLLHPFLLQDKSWSTKGDPLFNTLSVHTGSLYVFISINQICRCVADANMLIFLAEELRWLVRQSLVMLCNTGHLFFEQQLLYGCDC